jgi:hypothetical protein
MSVSADVHVSSPRERLGELVGAVSRETILAEASFAVIAVHVLDDNFLQPQPGTSAADHLVSGLVPFAVLLAVATVYPRLRPGSLRWWDSSA